MKNKSASNEIFKIKVRGVLAGCIVISLGILLLKSGFFRGVAVTPFSSRFIITVGIFIVIYGLIRKIDPTEYENSKKYLICSKCHSIYELINDKLKCNKCNCDLDQLEGFLDRNPGVLAKEKIAETQSSSLVSAAFTVIIALLTSVLMVFALIHFIDVL